MKLQRIKISEFPLAFWKTNKQDLPILASLARIYLCPPPSSSASEREFKVGKSIQKDRVKLLPKNVEMLLFVKCYLRAVSYSTSLPSAPEQFTKPNSKIYDNIQENSESEDLSE